MATVDVDPVNGVLAVSCSRRWLGQLSKETMTRVQESAGPLDLGLVTSSEYEVAGHAQWLTMGVARAGVEGAANRGKTSGQSMQQGGNHILSF